MYSRVSRLRSRFYASYRKTLQAKNNDKYHHMYRTFRGSERQYEELENILHSLKLQFKNDQTDRTTNSKKPYRVYASYDKFQLENHYYL